MSAEGSAPRAKLGLALAGGGFRASLFHLGVLRRLAELDLLRYVEVLSTVSGGSVIGAAYILLLKRALEGGSSGTLKQGDYEKIIDELQATMRAGIQKNLRTRLLMNPLGILRVLLTPQSLGERMGRLYERHLYRDLVPPGLAIARRFSRRGSGRIRLKDVHIRPKGQLLAQGTEDYNAGQVGDPSRRGSAATRIVLNATSLNSGGRFWFAPDEIGDWFLGHIRHSDVDLLLRRKELVQGRDPKELEQKLQSGGRLFIERVECSPASMAMALWRRRWILWANKKEPRGSPPVAPIPEWAEIFDPPESARRLIEADFGQLRTVQIPAWVLRYGPGRKITGGLAPDEWRRRLRQALARIDEGLADRLAPMLDGDREDLLLELLTELYWTRTAEIMSFSAGRDWDRFTLGEAVGASACFPPVFPPYQVYGFYDDGHVNRLGLTDGGVFDNVGLTALLDENCNYIIASDTSGVLGIRQRASVGRVGMSARISSLLMENVGWKQRTALQERRRVSERLATAVDAGSAASDTAELAEFLRGRELRDLAFFHIKSQPPGGPGLDREVDREDLARVRTDLDSFGDVEIAELVNHGYDTADRFIRRYFAGSPYDPGWVPPVREPCPSGRDRQQVHRVIRVGQSRFLRAIKLGAPAAILAVLAALGGALWATWEIRVSASQAIGWTAERAIAGAASWMPPITTDLVDRPVSLGLALLVVAGLVVLKVAFRAPTRLDPVDRLWRGGSFGAARTLARLARWIRGFSWNGLWLFGWPPLVIALGGSAIATLMHVFLNRPFLRATADPAAFGGGGAAGRRPR